MLLILIGLGSFVFVLKKFSVPDETSDGAKTSSGIVREDGTLCLVDKLSTAKDPSDIDHEEGHGYCYGNASLELDKFLHTLKRGAHVAVTYAYVNGSQEVREVNVDGKTAFTDAGHTLGWKRYILHIGAAAIALLGFLMLYAARKDP